MFESFLVDDTLADCRKMRTALIKNEDSESTLSVTDQSEQREPRGSPEPVVTAPNQEDTRRDVCTSQHHRWCVWFESKQQSANSF